MQVFIARGTDQYGPYPLEQIRGLLEKGVLQPGDYAYHEGLSGWKPLSEVIAAQSEPAAPPSKETSPSPEAGPSLTATSTPESKSMAPLVIAIVAGLWILGGLAAAGGLYFFPKDKPTEFAETITPDYTAPSPKTSISTHLPTNPSTLMPGLPKVDPEPNPTVALPTPPVKKPGTLLWEFTTGAPVGSSPAIGADGTVYIGSSDKKVYALDGKTGAKKWEFVTGHAVWSSPAIGADGTVYVGSDGKKVYALDGKTGVRKWEFVVGSYVRSSPAIGVDGTVYVGSFDNKIFALDGKTGAKKWEFVTGETVRSSPAIGVDGTVYVGSWDSQVYALDGKPGAKKWDFETGRELKSSPAIGVDGTVYIGSFDGNVYAIKTNSKDLAKTPNTPAALQ